jgi:hypothetical protein
MIGIDARVRTFGAFMDDDLRFGWRERISFHMVVCQVVYFFEMIAGLDYILCEPYLISRACEGVAGSVPNHERIKVGRLELGCSSNKNTVEPVIDIFFLFSRFQPVAKGAQLFIAPESKHINQGVQIKATDTPH